MTIRILDPGLQTTIQSAPRAGWRHQGVPASGAADPLSLALANRLLGNPVLAPALELTLNGIRFVAATQVAIAVTGATAGCTLNGQAFDQHSVMHVNVDDEVVVGAAEHGVRNYVAFAGGLVAQSFLGSESTYMPAVFGGHAGRALEKDDVIALRAPALVPKMQTPSAYRLPMQPRWTLRACNSAETELLKDPAELFGTTFTVSNRSDRMGIRLDGARLAIEAKGGMQSAAVFPGMVQCPSDGRPYLLGADAQTTGGYPRIAKVARLDLHILGQLRCGDAVKLMFRDEQTAADELQKKRRYWGRWLEDLTSVI